MTDHWIGNLKMKPIYVDELFDRKFIINELESSLNGCYKKESSVVAGYKTEASVVAEMVQYDASVIT